MRGSSSKNFEITNCITIPVPIYWQNCIQLSGYFLSQCNLNKWPLYFKNMTMERVNRRFTRLLSRGFKLWGEFGLAVLVFHGVQKKH